ncbi:unnamed protein product [Discula destructiva]
MTFNIHKLFSSKSSCRQYRTSRFTQLNKKKDPYAVHSTDAEDIEAVKRKAYDERRAREAEAYLAKYGYGGVGSGALRGLR